MPGFEKLVIVTKKTALDELVERFNTREQARFYLEHAGASFDDYQQAHDAYERALETVRRFIPKGVRAQWIERTFLPTFTFGPEDLVVTLGPDGLVVNTAKYLTGQPLLALNPDPQRMDGVLIPLRVDEAARALTNAARGQFSLKQVRMARAALNDGQSILAVNDLFVGQRTHTSARYRLRLGKDNEQQSSSGIIVSTGAGSTGWLRSVLTGASEVVGVFVPDNENVRGVQEQYRFDWEADFLRYSVREPFVSKTSGARLCFGQIDAGTELEVTSQMPQNGVIFSDGVEEDFLAFNSGAIARIGLADRTLPLIVRA